MNPSHHSIHVCLSSYETHIPDEYFRHHCCKTKTQTAAGLCHVWSGDIFYIEQQKLMCLDSGWVRNAVVHEPMWFEMMYLQFTSAHKNAIVMDIDGDGYLDR